MHQRTTLNTGENCLVEIVFLSGFLIGKDHTTSWSSQCFMGCCGNNICIRDWAWMKTCGYQSCDMCHVYHQYSTYFICHFSEFLKINGSCISAGTCNDHLRLTFQSQFSHSVIIQETIIIYTIRYYLKIFTGYIHW